MKRILIHESTSSCNNGKRIELYRCHTYDSYRTVLGMTVSRVLVLLLYALHYIHRVSTRHVSGSIQVHPCSDGFKSQEILWWVARSYKNYLVPQVCSSVI